MSNSTRYVPGGPLSASAGGFGFEDVSGSFVSGGGSGGGGGAEQAFIRVSYTDDVVEANKL